MKIEIWSDIICPFCYIGKRKLELALEQTGIKATIDWRSFELNPAASQSYGMPLPDVMESLYGFGRSRALTILATEEYEAKKVGLDFQWRKAKPGNTFNAHRLIHLAKHHDLGPAAKERFLRAYFTEGQDIGDPKVLRAAALEVGLTAKDVDEVLSTNKYGDEVRGDEDLARKLGIRGVPYFRINGSKTLSGARDVSDFVDALVSEATPEDTASSGGGTCENGFCEIRR